MKKFKAQKERKQQDAIVRPRLEIEDPSAELFSLTRSWEQNDPLQDSFLEHQEEPKATKDLPRLPKLRYRSATDPIPPLLSSSENVAVQIDHSIRQYDPSPEVVLGSVPPYPIQKQAPPIVPSRKSSSEKVSPIKSRRKSRSQSLPRVENVEYLPLVPPKANFVLFSQRCAPSPTSSSPPNSTPVFELSAEEASFSMMSKSPIESPVELEGSPVDLTTLQPAPLQFQKQGPETEPEASPYSRFTTYTKSIHTLNANLSPIEETEEEAASRRTSMIQQIQQIHELPTTAPRFPFSLSSYSGGTSIVPRNYRYTIAAPDVANLGPARNMSTRSSNSTASTTSTQSVFSFEVSGSDTDKIYISLPKERRKSSAPSLTDVSSDDEFDLDFESELEDHPSRPVSKRDAKLERFFGIKQCSITSGSETSLNLDSVQSPTSPAVSVHSVVTRPQFSYKHTRPSVSIDDLDTSLAAENDPIRREMIAMHRSLLTKSQNKQDAKLEKFFGCGKYQIQVARNFSTGSRLAGCTDDLNNRSRGW